MGKIGQNLNIGQLRRLVSRNNVSLKYLIAYLVYADYHWNSSIRNNRCTDKLTGPWKLPGHWSTTWSKQYLSAVHSVTCSLFDRLLISDYRGQ